MWPASRARLTISLGVAGACLIGLCAVVAAQPAQPARPQGVQGIESDATSETLEKYLKQKGLTSVLAAHLRRRVKDGVLTERVRAANLLGDLYVEELRRVTDATERQKLEEQARD